jgi:hypothetical protein
MPLISRRDFLFLTGTGIGEIYLGSLAQLSAFASIHRATDRHGSARVLRPDSILDYDRPGDETIQFPTLL